jgi:rod shape determining protein RodA
LNYSPAISTRDLRQGSRLAKPHFDIPLLLITYAIAIFGLIAITAASYTPGQTSAVDTLFARITQTRNGQKQGIFLLVSPIVIAGVMSIDYRFLGNRLFANLLFWATCGLLFMTYVVAEAFSGVKGWLNIVYDYTVQPAEIAKIAIIIRLAQMLSHKENPISSAWDFIRMMVVIGVPAGLILVAGEMGSAVVIVFFFLAMIITAGVDIRVITGIILGGLSAMIPLILVMRNSGSYRFNRLLGFIYPELAPADITYQQRNSQTAVGAGGWSGVGMFKDGSYTSLKFVPEGSTDFIFSSIGETMGFVGCAALLLLYLLLVVRMLILAYNTHDRFGRLLITGVAAMLTYHIFQGVGMAIGLMPVMGIPLPFVSYGGSNLTTNMAGIALVLNVTLRKPQLALATEGAAQRRGKLPKPSRKAA